jgi:enoyl-CoA hydratase/carnithine racemase
MIGEGDVSGSSPKMISETSNGILTLRLNRASHGNAIDDAMKRALISSLASAGTDDDVRGVLVASSGRDFSLGQDMEEFRSLGPETIGDWLEANGELRDALRGFLKPIVAAVCGRTKGEAFQMLMLCDAVVASKDATFQLSAINLGIPCINGVGTLWHSIGRQRIQQLVFLGEDLSANEARRAGLIYEVVPSDQLIEAASALLKRMAWKDPRAVATNKEWVNALTQELYERTRQRAVEGHTRVFATGGPRDAMARYLEEE